MDTAQKIKEEPDQTGQEKKKSKEEKSGKKDGKDSKKEKTFDKKLKEKISENEKLKKINDISDKTKQKIDKKLGTNTDNLSAGFNMAKNPLGFAKSLVNFIPHFAILTAIMELPQIVDGITKWLTKRGGLLDRTFKRRSSDERNPFLSREQQQQRKLGYDVVIATQQSGFGNQGGALTTNTLSQVKTHGLSDIGLRDESGGLI